MPPPGEVDELAVGVELALTGRAVADPDRAGAAPALEIAELQRRQAALAADAVDDLEVTGVAGGGGMMNARKASASRVAPISANASELKLESRTQA